MLQFVYAVIGFGLCYVIISAIAAPFSYIIAAPIALFVVFIDFVKINERPFLDFFKSAIMYASSPRQRYWHQGDDTDLNIEIYEIKKAAGPVAPSKNISAAEISKLAHTLDSQKQ